MKTVILGAAGQLGRHLCQVLPGEIVALTRADADLTKPDALRLALRQHEPGVVINAAAYTRVDQAESAPSDAFAVNALAVRNLALLCRDLDCTLIHFSTDYVFGFDSLRTSPYSETDAPGPINVYGASKLAGEQFVQSICAKYFIVRTCGLYGFGGKNFVETILGQAEQGELVRVVNDQTCTPTATADLARAVCELLTTQAYGLYHVTNAGACTWHEFAEAIFEYAGVTTPLAAIRSDAYDSPARRPRLSVLSNARWIDCGFTPLRSWQEALAAYLGERGKASVTPVPVSSDG